MKHLVLFILLVSVAVVGCKKDDDQDDTTNNNRTISYYVRTDSDSLKVIYIDQAGNPITFIQSTPEWNLDIITQPGDSVALEVWALEECKTELAIYQDSVRVQWFEYDNMYQYSIEKISHTVN
jgi:hypothetical protein